jgi:hypothetical protein
MTSGGDGPVFVGMSSVGHGGGANGGGGATIVAGAGRGRGRGRGAAINVPAWMTSAAVVSGGASSDPSSGGDELLARALRAQKEQASKFPGNGPGGGDDECATGNSRGGATMSSSSSSNETSRDHRRAGDGKSEASNGGWRGEAGGGSAGKGREGARVGRAEEEEEERDRRERRRREEEEEEEERRRLRALVGDVDDDKGSSGGMNESKRGPAGEDEGGVVPFEFEKEEEREDRIASERREERRRKRPRATANAEEGEGHSGHAAAVVVVDERDDAKEVVVDRPRNAMGVILSESNDAAVLAGRRAEEDTAMDADAATNAGGDGGTGVAAKENDVDYSDSFDIFAADGATPVPAAEMGGGRDGGVRAPGAATANDAQECDDAEGYYKASIGEIVALPKEKRDRGGSSGGDGGDGDEQHRRMARFRVLGIIGKGVFSSVIKCVEEGTDGGGGASGAANGDGVGGGRIVAMKIIRNNEVMAKAAAKEMRILRILCHQSTESSGRVKRSRKEGCAESALKDVIDPEANEEDEDDAEERERRERENHNIVRLVDVDPDISSAATDAYLSSHAFSAPPLEFRSHCVFLFEFLPYNLREVLSKFGKNVGINLTAVRSYARQLLCALAHLERHRVVHGVSQLIICIIRCLFFAQGFA